MIGQSRFFGDAQPNTAKLNILFYLQGGLKAVIWTDVFQSLIMIAGLIVVVIVGSIEVGGFDRVWQINKDFGRLNFFE